MEDESRCAAVARASEPRPGTAPRADRWLLVEDHGPWGHDALRDGHLPTAVSAHLVAQTEVHGVRYQAIRRPDRSRRTTRAVFLVNVVAGWMARRDLPVEDLLDLDLAQLTADRAPTDATPVTEPVVAVCTHGTRDACCAVWGRPLVAELSARGGAAVWETSHTGGHRFAPNVLVFPWGAVHGGVSDVAAFWHATAGRRIDLATYRGNSAHPQAAQAAEVAVRRRLGLGDPGQVTVVRAEVDGDDARVHVSHDAHDGPQESVVVLVRRTLPDAAVSCGADPVPRATWQVVTTD